jgi:hypothetical protein
MVMIMSKSTKTVLTLFFFCLKIEFTFSDYSSESKPMALDLKSGDQIIVVFNPLGTVKHDIVSFFVERQDHAICIKDPDEKYVPYQVNYYSKIKCKIR